MPAYTKQFVLMTTQLCVHTLQDNGVDVQNEAEHNGRHCHLIPHMTNVYHKVSCFSIANTLDYLNTHCWSTAHTVPTALLYGIVLYSLMSRTTTPVF